MKISICIYCYRRVSFNKLFIKIRLKKIFIYVRIKRVTHKEKSVHPRRNILDMILQCLCHWKLLSHPRRYARSLSIFHRRYSRDVQSCTFTTCAWSSQTLRGYTEIRFYSYIFRIIIRILKFNINVLPYIRTPCYYRYGYTL